MILIAFSPPFSILIQMPLAPFMLELLHNSHLHLGGFTNKGNVNHWITTHEADTFLATKQALDSVISLTDCLADWLTKNISPHWTPLSTMFRWQLGWNSRQKVPTLYLVHQQGLIIWVLKCVILLNYFAWYTRRAVSPPKYYWNAFLFIIAGKYPKTVTQSQIFSLQVISS